MGRADRRGDRSSRRAQDRRRARPDGALRRQGAGHIRLLPRSGRLADGIHVLRRQVALESPAATVEKRGSTTMVKLTVLYGQPKSAAAFEKYYAETHLPLAAKMQGVRRIELSKVTSAADGSAPAFYRLADLYFDDADHM